MRIAVNTRLLIRNRLEGIGWFTYESLKRITMQHPGHTFYFIFDRPYDKDFIFSENIQPIVLSPQARHPLLFFIWFDMRLPALLRKLKPDLFLSPDGYLSLRTDIPSLAVIHDLNFEHYPEDLPYWTSRYYRHYFPRFAHKAKRIATVSQYSKQDIINQYEVPEGKIDVVFDGSSELYRPLSEEEKKAVREKYSGSAPYFVFIGSLHPRKNLVNLFRAFDQFRATTPSNVKLLVVGARKWWTKEIRQSYDEMRHRGDVIFCGRLNIGELKDVLGAALALTYVSYFEGFGIPIVEAFRCETPVITANLTSMPEIAGDAALLIDPFSTESIAGAMQKIFSDPGLCRELVTRGRARKEEFTWQKTADRLWNSIEKTVNHTA